MKKEMKKILLIFILSIIVIFSFNQEVYARDPADYEEIETSTSSSTDTESDSSSSSSSSSSTYGFDWTRLDNVTSTPLDSTIYSVFGIIINIIKIVGAGIAIVMLMVIGIRFMSQAPEARAEYKEKITPYVIGAVILFAASSIVQLVQMLASGITSSI